MEELELALRFPEHTHRRETAVRALGGMFHSSLGYHRLSWMPTLGLVCHGQNDRMQLTGKEEGEQIREPEEVGFFKGLLAEDPPRVMTGGINWTYLVTASGRVYNCG